MRVLTIGAVSVYVYDERGQPHMLPHCHVRWSGQDAVLALGTLTLLVGPEPSKAVLEHLAANLETLWAEWDRLNP